MVLKIRSLSVAYGDHLVLNQVSLKVAAGEVLALIGPNGAGKSTLIRAVSGVVPVLGGEVWIAEQKMETLSPGARARYLSVVPQARQLPASFTVRQTVLLGRTPYLGWLGHPGENDHRLVRQALSQTHLPALADRQVGQLSGGEQQRVLLARALAQDTPVLLLDEPTTHLDLQHQSRLLHLVRALAREKQLAVLMVLHDLNLAGLYSDRVAILVEGKIQVVGRPEDVLTEENLSAVYHVPVHVIPHPQYGTPLVLPDGNEDSEG